MCFGYQRVYVRSFSRCTLLVVVVVVVVRGVHRKVLRGFTKSSWGSGGRCEPASRVRGRAPEDFEINTF